MRHAFLIIALLSCFLSKAQPFTSAINKSDAFDLINNFQSDLHHIKPSSFFLLVSDFKTYLNNITNADKYLHIYFAAKDAAATNKTLAIIGTVYSGANKIHYPTDEKVWSAEPSIAPTATMIFDENIDPYFEDIQMNKIPIDVNYLPSCGGSCPTGEITKNTADSWIQNYQAKNAQGAAQPYDNTQSFFMSANALLDFLNTNSDVMYLQFYIAQNISIKSTKDKYAIIIVGVDNIGKHVYAKGGPYALKNYVMDEGLPCPLCGIDLDAHLPHVQSSKK